MQKVFPACCRCRKRNRYKTHCIFIFIRCRKNPIVPHAKIEAMIKASGMLHIPKTEFFMQNLLSQHGDELRNEKIIEVPAGKGKQVL